MKKIENVIMYDVSAVINSGTKASRSKTWNVNNFPTGGLYKLMEFLEKDIDFARNGTTAIVMCFDGNSSSSWRKLNCPWYKANRIIKFPEIKDKNGDNINYSLSSDLTVEEYGFLPKAIQEKIALQHAVSLQIELLKKFIGKFNVNVLYKDEIEADDIMYSIGVAYKDAKIQLRADDSDLMDISLYCKNFSMKSVAGNGDNYGNIEIRKGQLLNKIFFGDTKDNVENIVKINSMACNAAQKAIVEGLINPYEVKQGAVVNPEPINRLGLPADISRKITNNIYLILPFMFEAHVVLSDNINLDEIQKFCSAFFLMKSLKKMSRPRLEGREIEDIFIRHSQGIKSYLKYYYGKNKYEAYSSEVEKTRLNDLENAMKSI